MRTRGFTTPSQNLKQFLRNALSNPGNLQTPAGILFLTHEVGSTLYNFLVRNDEPLDLHTPLTTLGTDSLVSIELRNWFRQKLGLEFTILELVGASSIRQLGDMTAVKLIEKYKTRVYIGRPSFKISNYETSLDLFRLCT